MAETTVMAPAGEKQGLRKKSFTFFTDVAKREMRKVSWPKRAEASGRDRYHARTMRGDGAIHVRGR